MAGGVGCVLQVSAECNKKLTVKEVLERGSAEEQGMLAGDIVLGIDGHLLQSLHPRGFRVGMPSPLMGLCGTDVVVDLRRGSSEFNLLLRRAPWSYPQERFLTVPSIKALSPNSTHVSPIRECDIRSSVIGELGYQQQPCRPAGRNAPALADPSVLSPRSHLSLETPSQINFQLENLADTMAKRSEADGNNQKVCGNGTAACNSYTSFSRDDGHHEITMHDHRHDSHKEIRETWLTVSLEPTTLSTQMPSQRLVVEQKQSTTKPQPSIVHGILKNPFPVLTKPSPPTAHRATATDLLNESLTRLASNRSPTGCVYEADTSTLEPNMMPWSVLIPDDQPTVSATFVTVESAGSIIRAVESCGLTPKVSSAHPSHEQIVDRDDSLASAQEAGSQNISSTMLEFKERAENRVLPDRLEKSQRALPPPVNIIAQEKRLLALQLMDGEARDESRSIAFSDRQSVGPMPKNASCLPSLAALKKETWNLGAAAKDSVDPTEPLNRYRDARLQANIDEENKPPSATDLFHVGNGVASPASEPYNNIYRLPLKGQTSAFQGGQRLAENPPRRVPFGPVSGNELRNAANGAQVKVREECGGVGSTFADFMSAGRDDFSRHAALPGRDSAARRFSARIQTDGAGRVLRTPGRNTIARDTLPVGIEGFQSYAMEKILHGSRNGRLLEEWEPDEKYEPCARAKPVQMPSDSSSQMWQYAQADSQATTATFDEGALAQGYYVA